MDHPGRPAEVRVRVELTEDELHFEARSTLLGFILFLAASALNKNVFSISVVNQVEYLFLLPHKISFLKNQNMAGKERFKRMTVKSQNF